MNRHGWLTFALLVTLCPPLAGCRSGAPEVESRGMSRTSTLQATGTGTAAGLPPLRTTPEASAVPAVTPVSHSQEESELPLPPDLDSAPVAPAEVLDGQSPLQLHNVIASVQESYPLLRSALLERQIADGKQLSAWGAFDLEVKAFGIAAPEGYYRTYRNGIGLSQPVFAGGYVYGGYKIGDGNFEPWYGGRETNEGGEFSAGLGVPLLANRTIDKRREALFKAELDRQAVEPAIRAQLLEFVRVASQVYWSWVAAGQTLEAQRELLRLAQARVDQIEERVNAGDLARIARINNDQLIAARETKVIESDRKLQEAAIKLSLFLRKENGQPIVPHESQLPNAFPLSSPPAPQQLEADIARALAARPELVELELIAEQVRVELAQAENLLLPELDAQLLAVKDVGAAASAKGDKTPLQLEIGLYGELPLQRREARGKIEAAHGKLAQIAAKRRFVTDKVAALVQDAFSALTAAAGRIDRARTNLRLARETSVLGREQFNAGDIDLIALNIYEQSVTDAELLLIAAQADFFEALADYRAALSLDPPVAGRAAFKP